MGAISLGGETLAPVTGVATGSTASANAGYSFTHWTNGAGATVGIGETLVPQKMNGLNAADTYTAHFAQNDDVTILYVSDDLAAGIVTPGGESLPPATGVAIGATAFANPGFIFTHWTNEAEDIVGVDEAFTPEKVNGLHVKDTHTAFFAEDDFVEIEYLSVDTVKGTVLPDAEYLAPVTGSVLGSTAVAKPGYRFAYWTNSAGTVVGMDAKLVPAKVNGLNAGDAYTAHFEENRDVSILYLSESLEKGIVTPGSESLPPATGISAGSVASARPGYTFTHWTDSTGAIVSTDAAFVPAMANGLNAAGAYTAHFAEDDGVTILYMSEGIGKGTITVTSETLPPATGVAAGSLAVANDGFRFTHWSNQIGVIVSTNAAFVPNRVNGLNVGSVYVAHFTEIDVNETSSAVRPPVSSANTPPVGDGIEPIAQADFERYVNRNIAQDLVMGVMTTLDGNFFAGLSGSNTGDMEVSSLLHGYSTVTWGRSGRFVIDSMVLMNLVVADDEAGNRTYDFTLHRNLTYNDGTPITAKDYVFSALLLSSPIFTEAGGVSTTLQTLQGYDAYRAGAPFTGVRLTGEYTFSLTIAAENLPYFYEMSLVGVTPYPMHVIAPGCELRDDGEGAYIDGPFTAELIEETVLSEEGYMRRPKITSGPYELVEYDEEERSAILVRNGRYKGNYEGWTPFIGKVIVQSSDPMSMMVDLDEGRLDLIGKASHKDMFAYAQGMEAEGDAKLFDYDGSGSTFIQFACARGFTRYASVRKAVAMSLDVPTLIEEHLPDIGSPVYGYYGLGQWMSVLGQEMLGELPRYSYNLSEAMRLLAEDGWVYNEDGSAYDETVGGVRYRLSETGELEELVLTYEDINMVEHAVWQVLAESLTIVGIRLELAKPGEPFDLSCTEVQFNAAFDPYFTYSTEEEFQGTFNITGMKDETLRALAEDLRRTEPGDYEGYLEKWLAFQKHWVEMLPMAPLYSNIYSDFMRPDLQNYTTNAFFTWDYAVLYAYLGDQSKDLAISVGAGVK